MRNWKEIKKFEEILFEEYNGIAKITINRPQYRNAFTPKTTWEFSLYVVRCKTYLWCCLLVRCLMCQKVKRLAM